MLKIIFAGTPDFAVPALKKLHESPHIISAVFTQPDRPKGRGQKLQMSPVKKYATEHNIPICQPLSLRDEQQEKLIKAFNADLMVVVAYGLIIPKNILAIPKYGCINIHASLLPRWRGAAPIQHAILSGDRETGITIMQMNEGLDTGDILKQQPVIIGQRDTSQTLHDQLSLMGSDLLLKTLDDLEKNTLQPQKQNDAQATYAKKIHKEDAQIDWNQDAAQIDRQIRAYNPSPVAFTFLNKNLIRIWQAELIPSIHHANPGIIINIDKKGIDVACGKDYLRISEIQLSGGKRIKITDFLNAHKDFFKLNTQFNHE